MITPIRTNIRHIGAAGGLCRKSYSVQGWFKDLLGERFPAVTQSAHKRGRLANETQKHSVLE